MKWLHIQVQPARSPNLDINQAVARLSGLAADVHITECVDNGPYVDLDFKVADLVGLWASVSNELRAMRELAVAPLSPDRALGTVGVATELVVASCLRGRGWFWVGERGVP